MSEASLITIEPHDAAPPADDGPKCRKCGAANSDSICRNCGYYAVLDCVVDLDDADRDGVEEDQREQAPSHLEVWLNLLPRWAWALFACVTAVVAESVVAAVTLPAGSALRMTWSLTQLAIGFFAFLAMHVAVYVMVIMDSDEIKILDIILRPIRCWQPCIRRLPATLIQVAVGACGLTAVVMSLAVIRSIPYERLLDWGIEPAPKTNLLGAVVAQAKRIEAKDEDLESAIRGFADEALDDLPLPKEEAKPEVPVECVIVGFTTREPDDGEFVSLIVAGDVDGELRIIGYVSAGISDDVHAELNERMRLLEQPTPFVDTQIKARWVQPKLTCRVLCVRQKQNGMLEEPIFEKRLRDISF